MRHLAPITLVAAMSEPPAEWSPVMFVPFGDRPEQAGALLTKKLASQPIVPPSFAIDEDGSLWLLDLVKHRIVHYAPSGKVLSIVGGLEFSRFRPYAQDLGFAAGRLYVKEFTHHTLQSFVRTVSMRGIGKRVRVENHGRPLVINHLVSPQPTLTGESDGWSGVVGNGPPGGGEVGTQVIDADSGVSRTVVGPILDDGTRLGIAPLGFHENQQVVIHHETENGETQRVVHLRVQPSLTDTTRIRVVAGWQAYAALPHGFAARVGFSPSFLRDQDRYRGSTVWLLEFFDDGQPLVWEPMPKSPLEGAHVWRYLCQGLDGHLYLMLAEKGGMQIYRRPGPPAH